MELHLFNSLQKKITKLNLQTGQIINIYLCGPTVYDHIHLGNLRPVIIFDILHRLLLHLNIKVNYIQNITDIDDKIITKAQKERKNEKTVSQHYTKAYLTNLVNYKVLLPTSLPRVTDFIIPIQNFITELEKKGAAYSRTGGVFFRIENYPEYGRLSGQNLTKLKENTRETIAQNNKESKHDFALWKKTKNGLVWNSPWGEGRPGWHTECAVFIQEFFAAKTIDIHGGGNDLLFPHHENERIQYLAHNNRELSKVWLHVAHLHWKKQKMSKSLGNVILAKNFAQKYGTNVLRYLILSSPYRQVINLSEDLIQQAINYLKKIENLLKRLNFYLYTGKIGVEKKPSHSNQNVINCLLNDLDTPQVLFWLEKIRVVLNKKITQKENNLDFKNTLADLFFIFDLCGFNFEMQPYNLKTKLLIQKWQKLVQNKQYLQADQVRNELIKNNII
ncbi:MAG: cysteinyl-tRNA synthetase [Mycoplasmataceae bacterium RC_NB112A]|nr:MAG: cysteinyl-tRNA synthetase [Mycoplasmataceae bacterium RC_NB112A]